MHNLYANFVIILEICKDFYKDLANERVIGSSRARVFHPHPLTEPCVKVSPHTALHTQLFVHRHNTNGFASFIIPSSLFKSCIISVAWVCHPLRSMSITDTSSNGSLAFSSVIRTSLQRSPPQRFRLQQLAEGLLPVPADRHRETFSHLIGSYGYILYGILSRRTKRI